MIVADRGLLIDYSR